MIISEVEFSLWSLLRHKMISYSPPLKRKKGCGRCLQVDGSGSKRGSTEVNALIWWFCCLAHKFLGSFFLAHCPISFWWQQEIWWMLWWRDEQQAAFGFGSTYLTRFRFSMRCFKYDFCFICFVLCVSFRFHLFWFLGGGGSCSIQFHLMHWIKVIALAIDREEVTFSLKCFYYFESHTILETKLIGECWIDLSNAWGTGLNSDVSFPFIFLVNLAHG